MAEEKASINVTPPSQYGMSINVSTSENNQIDLVPNKQNIDITTSSPNYMPLNATPDLSMYYSEVSEDWAKQAENSAERAAQSATTAKDAADSILNNPEVQEVLNSLDIIEAAPENAQIAQEQATISKTYAESASTSSTIAQEQATIATTQANLILEQIDDVEQAVKAANTSATNADTSANSAKGYMQSAEASAIAAKASETSAKQSASEALASKNSASSSATSASTSASTATTKASEAKTSATQAANSATSASNSATQAQGYAQDALNSKNQAQDIVEQGIEDIQEILENAGGGGSIDESNLVHKDGAETITGAKTFTGAVNLIGSGDSNAVGISTNTRFNVHNTTQTVLGFGSGLFYINHGNYRLRLRGKDARPHYNSDSNYLALLSDVPDVSNFITMTDVENKGYLTSVPSEYVTDTELSTYAYDKVTVDGKIADAVTGGSIDAYTKSETDALLDKKQDVLSATNPLEIGSKTVGGPYNIATESGYIVPTYKGFPSSRYTIDTSNRLISISNPNATQSITDINSLFSGNCSYFDVPVDFASRISKVQNGEESFASIEMQLKGVQTAGNVISFLAGQQTDTEFIPIIFGKAGNTTSEGMLIGTALLTGKVTPYTSGVSLEYDSAGTTGTSYSDSTFGIGANFSFNYNPNSNYPLSINTYSYNATTGYYTRVRKTSVTPELLANLSKINVIRVFWGDTNGGTSVKYFPTVEDTQLKYNYVDTGWRITNGAVTTYGVSLKYDNTLKVVDGELSANLDVIATSEALEVKQDKLTAGENITIEDNVISAVVPEAGGAGFNLFDTKLSDHILEGEEAQGWALQGTYVYKEAVAGSRDGYPDFYQRCISEFQNSTKQEVYWVQPTLTENGVLGGDSFAVSGTQADTNYAAYNAFDNNSSTDWVSASANEDLIIYNPVPISITKINVTNRNSSTVRYIKSGTIYGSNDNLQYVQIGTFTNTEKTQLGQWSIDLSANTNAYKYYKLSVLGDTYCSANQITTIASVPSYIYTNSNGHQFYDIADKAYLDDIFATTGMAWFYGIDTENERVFLPREIKRVLVDKKEPTETDPTWYNLYSDGWLEQGSIVTIARGATTYNLIKPYASTAYSLQITPATYQNHDDNIYVSSRTASTFTTQGSSAGATDSGMTFEVFWEACGYTQKLETKEDYLYICVGNTTSTSAVTDVVEVTTTENDTTPLFTGMYFDFTPNNPSWLKAGQQHNNAGIYTFAYSELVKELTAPKYNLKVIEEANMVTGVDYSEYWKVNQTNMTFTAPSVAGLFPNNRILVAKKEATDDDPTWYNLYSDGWCEQGGVTTPSSSLNKIVTFLKPYRDIAYTVVFGNSFTTTTTATACVITSTKTTTGFTLVDGTNTAYYSYWQTSGYTTIPTVSDYTENVNLYFKVANAVQNLELLDVGAVTETLANKVDINSKVIDGQWVQNVVNLGTQTAKGTYLCDISTVLPNDGYDYEVMLNLRAYNSNSSNSGDVYIYSDIFTKLGTGVYDSQGTCGGNGRQVANTFILPVGAGRTITYEIATYAVSNLSLNIWGYRRVGTNL